MVGGGVSGLATAWHLQQALAEHGGEVILLEAAGRPGGTAWTERQAGYSLETGPNGFLDNKPSTLELCRSLGLEDTLVRANESAANRFVFLGDRLRKLPARPLEFLRCDLLSWRGKLRVLAERLVRPRRTGEDESIHAFGCRRIGREATEVLLDAFVTGILAGDATLLSLPACFPRMVELERDYGGLLRAQGKIARQRRAERRAQGLPDQPSGSTGGPGGILTVTRGGLRALVERLVERLGSVVQFATPVTAVERDPQGGWHVRCDRGQSWPADAVVLACPAYEQAKQLHPVDTTLAQEVSAIAYSSVVVAVLGFRQDELTTDVNGFGYLAPQRLGRPVLGILWSSSIFPEQAPEGFFQFRAILGGWRRRDVLEWDDSQILQAVRDDLRESMGILAQPRFTWICRWENAIPQYHLGHLDRLARIDSRLAGLSGLFLTGNSFRGVALNDCCREAEQTAQRVAKYLLEP